MDTVQLEKLKIGVIQSVSEELLDAGTEVYFDALLNRIKVSIHGYVWAERESAKRQIIQFPRDWWQAFKERWFPKWLLNKYPVDYHIIDIDVKAIYPKFKAAVPKQTHILTIQRQDRFSSYDWRNE